MTKKEIVKDISDATGLTQLKTKEVVQKTFDSIVETHIFEYHGESRADLYFTKDMLLAVGDRYETEIAAAKSADAKYR